MKWIFLLACAVTVAFALSACDTIAAGLAQVAGTALISIW